MANQETTYQIIQNFLSAMFRLGGGEGDQKRTGDLLIESELDNLRVLILAGVGSRQVIEYFQTPVYQGHWFLGTSRFEQAFRAMAFGADGARFEVQTRGEQPRWVRHHLESWRSTRPSWLPPSVAFSLGRMDFGRSELIPPFNRYPLEEGSVPRKSVQVSRPLPGECQDLARVVSLTGEPLQAPSARQGEVELIRCQPGQELADSLLVGRFALGKRQREAAAELGWQRWLLLGLGALVLWLVRQTARRFLAPVWQLTRACQQVTAGNYAVRLPEAWEQEFGVLSRAFNRMAREAEEGRLLGRFVSDAVRGLARSRTRAATAADGEAIEAVILFAGLPGSKKAMAEADAQALTESLNRHLRTMAPLIGRQGGEIDKFMGDKILAVFTTDRCGSLREAAAAAVRAAVDMTAAAGRQADATGGSPPAMDLFPPGIAIGLAAGPVLAGILGAPTVRLEYTVIGDTVNLASRLADLAAERGGGLFAEQGMADLLTGVSDPGLPRLEPLSAVRVKGKSREVALFQLRT